MSEYSPSWNDIFTSIITKFHESIHHFFNPIKEHTMTVTEDTQIREFREIRKWVKGFHRGSYNLVGFMMASYDKENNLVKIGWSFCAPQDVFSKKVAENIARGRINKMTTARIPRRYIDEVTEFVTTCENYYKTEDIYVCCGNTNETDPGYFFENPVTMKDCPFSKPCPICQDDSICGDCQICNNCNEECMGCTKCDSCPKYVKNNEEVVNVEVSDSDDNKLHTVSEL